jgi:hypothetical protein
LLDIASKADNDHFERPKNIKGDSRESKSKKKVLESQKNNRSRRDVINEQQ